MNYEKIYSDLVKKAKSENRKRRSRDSKKYVYYESHHIIPKCMNGEDTKENLVFLTAREHFIAHKLLVEIYSNNKKLEHALWMFVNGCKDKNQDRIFRVSSREYERIKKIRSNNLSELMKGRNVGEKNPMYGNTGEKNHFFGKTHSEETLDRLRFTSSNENREQVTCPHCGVIMNKANAYQYHFDRCLENPDNPDKDYTKRKMINSVAKAHEVITCPNCGMSGAKVNMLRYHFEHCEQAPVLSEKTKKRIKQREETEERNRLASIKEPKLYKCQYCNLESYDHTNMYKYHFENCKQNPNRQVILYKCEHCGIETENKTNIIRWHNDNCKQNPNNIKS